MNSRTLQRVIEAVPTSDGAGVKLRRSLGQSPYARLDPFLMLDHFSVPYGAGFPDHPHRGQAPGVDPAGRKYEVHRTLHRDRLRGRHRRACRRSIPAIRSDPDVS